MDFDLSEEQRLLKESVDRLIEDRYGDFDRRKSYQQKPQGWSRAVWQDFTDLGLTALPFGESSGGIGGGPVETMIVMEAIGRGLVLEPFLQTTVLGGAALKLGASTALAEAMVSQIIEGSLILALAHTEPQSRYNLSNVQTSARLANGQYILDGRKSLVENGDSADKLIVSARTSGGPTDGDGITLFLVDAKQPGVQIHGSASQDGKRVAEIIFSGAKASKDEILGVPDQGHALLSELICIGIAALAAESVGAMERLHAMTVDYLKTRKQFGVPIGSFQVLQHKSADMMVELEQARSMACYAAMMLSASPNERMAALSAVKIAINKASRFVGQQAIQLHGGIGMTLEYQASHYFKRLTAIEQTFGDTDYHLAELAKVEGEEAAIIA
ncbi:MAG: acyl-CoA dehydrogenase family protein [Rhodomicrobium sp.]